VTDAHHTRHRCRRTRHQRERVRDSAHHGVLTPTRSQAVPAEYSVPVLAVAVAGQRLLPSLGRMTAVLIALWPRFGPQSAPDLSSGRKSSRFGINSPYCNGAHRHDRVFVRSVGCCGYCSRRSGRTGVTRCSRDARHRGALASARVRCPLELELATAPRWSADAGRWHPCVDSPDAPCQPTLGAPRIHGELQKLGIAVAQATVAKYLGCAGDPPSQSWRTFLANHVSQLASIDFFTVPTAIFRVLFVFVVLSHDRRRGVHVNVTAHPTAAWTAQQLREAWPWDTDRNS
jgi:hypothetical protein